MRIYLDNNIIISIEKSEIELADLRNNFGTDAEFVYSNIQIQELLESGIRFDKLKENRLKTLRNITNCKHIITDYSQKIKSDFLVMTVDPKEILHNVQAISFINKILKISTNNLDNYRENLINVLKIDIKRLNNYSVDEVIEHINKAFIHNNFLDLRTSINRMGIRLQEQITSIFNMLDMIGFWKDEKTEKSNMARFYDASHVYFATGCDVFVSNDRRCIRKAKVAYSLKNIIGTEVIEWNKILKHRKRFIYD